MFCYIFQMKDIGAEGSISEWNEGSLKSVRLHESQTIINYAKMDLLGRSQGVGFNQSIWISGIEVLYGEGQSKYSNPEIKEIEKIRNLIRYYLEHNPVFIFVVEESIYSTKEKYVLDKGNWEKLRKIVELFEKYVKKYNDVHGLSTRNQSGGDLF